MSHYTPSPEILEKYADVMVNFGLGNGKGIKKGGVVLLGVPDSAKAFVEPLQAAILKAGGHYIMRYGYDNRRAESRTFYELASDEQLDFHPKDVILEYYNIADYALSVDATDDKHALDGVDSKKIARRKAGLKFAQDAMFKKVDAGKLSWTLCTYGTEALAEGAGMSIEEYWDQIIKACYLDHDDPVSEWRRIDAEQVRIREWLNSLEIQSVKVQGDDVDLTVRIGDKRQWLGGGGNNVPSFEIFTSPDWRGTNGRIKFNEPLSRFGVVIEGIRLEFKDGIITDISAEKNEQVLRNLISTLHADKLGEFSLTDKRMSRITRTMNDTLYDENIGGKYGNMHVAVGMAYKSAHTEDVPSVPEEEWEELGFNDSAEHTDIMSTTDRTVTATLKDGSEKVIYQDGMFTL